MNPILLEALKAWLAELLTKVIPDKDVTLKINIEVGITTPKRNSGDS